MSEPASKGPLPHALKVGRRRLKGVLKDAIDQCKRNRRYSNRRAIFRAVERFVDEFRRVPQWQAELERRAGLVEGLTAPGTTYAQAERAALKSYRRRATDDWALHVESRLRESLIDSPLLWDIAGKRDLLERVFAEGILELTPPAEAAFRQWLHECRAIQREAERLEVDGCCFLYHVHRAVEGDTSQPSTSLMRGIIQHGWSGIDGLEAMRAATDSVVAWAAAEPLVGQVEAAEGPVDESPRGRRKRRKYKTDNDPAGDARLVQGWKAAKRKGVPTIADFCRMRQLDEGDFRAALDRHRKR